MFNNMTMNDITFCVLEYDIVWFDFKRIQLKRGVYTLFKVSLQMHQAPEKFNEYVS